MASDGGDGTKAAILLFFLSFFHVSSADEPCLASGPCKCSNSQGTIDLTPLANTDNTPRFPDQMDQGGSWFYSYNPCLPFNEGAGDCNGVGVCQTDLATQYYNLGTQDSATFVFDATNNVNQIKYTGVGSLGTTRTTYVTLTCDQSQTGSLTVIGEDPPSSATYKMTLTSKYACYSGAPGPGPGGSGSISAGSVLVIVFFALVFVYIVGGISFQAFVRKASGREMVPNYNLWSALPGLIRDGVLFVVRCGKGSYTSI